MSEGIVSSYQLKSDQYEVIVRAFDAYGFPNTLIGIKGRCRFCGETSPKMFRKIAHTIPEFFGNKGVSSLDECDKCNALFSAYESELAERFRLFLTLGGVKGKNNKIPKMGNGNAARQIIRDQQSRINVTSKLSAGEDFSDYFSFDPFTKKFRISIAPPKARFRPRLAYKALTKIALSILPLEEMDKYRKLTAWILDKDENLDFQCLEVMASYSLQHIFNPPPIVDVAILRRKNPTQNIPYILFIMAAGPVCFQIDLMSDHMEDHLSVKEPGRIKFNWITRIGGSDSNHPISIKYTNHGWENWVCQDLTDVPLTPLNLNVELDQT